MGKRGRKPIYIAPEADELRRMIEEHIYLSDVCRHYGVSYKTLRRWMDERGVPMPEQEKLKTRSTTGGWTLFCPNTACNWKE